MVCVDDRDGQGLFRSSHCEVTAIDPAHVRLLEERNAGRLTVSVRPDATQADVETLAAVPFLKSLTVYAPEVTRLDVLASFRDLVTLGVDVHAYPSVTELGGTRIEALTVSGCGTVRDLRPARSLRALATLYVGSAPCVTIDRLDGIEEMPSLRTFTSFAGLGDTSALARATSLKHLELYNARAPLVDIAGLELESLTLVLRGETAAEAAQRFAAMPVLARLKRLGLWTARAPKLPAMPALTHLDVFLATHESVTDTVDLGFVRSTPNLEGLRVGGARRADVRPLLRLRRLQSLDLAGVCAVDGKVLEKLPKLTWVTLFEGSEYRPDRKGLEVVFSRPSAHCGP